MGMTKIELKWPIGVGGQESQLVVRREGGWFSDKLTLELDGDRIFTSPAGGFSAGMGSHCFCVRGVEFTLLWKWSTLTDYPKYIVLRSGDRLIYSYGNYDAAYEQLARRYHAVVTPLIILAVVVAAVTTNPSEARFRQRIRTEITQETDPLTGLVLGGVTAGAVVAATERYNLFVLSLYRTKIGGAHEIRLGAFGCIWGPFRL